jgi:hypothetical protein
MKTGEKVLTDFVVEEWREITKQTKINETNEIGFGSWGLESSPTPKTQNLFRLFRLFSFVSLSLFIPLPQNPLALENFTFRFPFWQDTFHIYCLTESKGRNFSGFPK